MQNVMKIIKKLLFSLIIGIFYALAFICIVFYIYSVYQSSLSEWVIYEQFKENSKIID